MRIKDAIGTCDQLYKNTYKYGNKIKWLSDLDMRIYTEIIRSRSTDTAVDFKGYTEDTDMETELLVPDAYAELYIQYLVSKIDYYNGEWERYNNSAAQFNELYANYAAEYSRTHKSTLMNKMRV